MSPAKVEADKKRGFIVPIGGAEDKEGTADILRKFIDVSGGAGSRIVIIPTASKLEDTGRRYEKLFKKLGADEAKSLPLASREDADKEEWLDYLEKANGIFVTGGNQLRLTTILGGTRVAKAIRRANARGVTVGGTSAGAAILSEHMIAFGAEGHTPHAGAVALVPGFGLTNRIVVDQHFRQRDRLGRLLTALAYNPFAVGIGLDEDTAAFIDHSRKLTVVGTGALTIVDASELTHSSIAETKEGRPVCMTNIRLHVLTAGGTFDLETRRASAPEESVMELLERRIYRGPSLYAHFPVMRLTIDLGKLESWPSGKIPGFNGALLKALPTLQSHTCSVGVEGGFIQRLEEDGGTWLGHVLEHVAIELQRLTGADVSFGKTRGEGSPGKYHVVYEYEEERVGEAAGDLALKLIHHILPADLQPSAPPDEAPFDFKTELVELIDYAQRRQLGPSTGSLVKAAEARDIPWMRLNDYSLVQFGHGKYQKRIQATVTSETRHIAVSIASDKEETNRILGDLGLPVPHQRLVRSPEGAIAAARRLGYPVVVKPLDANHGRGVSLDLKTEDEVRIAFDRAREHARSVVVENFLNGFDHRMLVVGEQLVAVAKRVPGHVVGDGEHTIAQLVEIVNADPRRGIGHEKVLTRLELDAQADRLMAAKNVTKDTVLPRGEVFYLRGTGNLSTGGTAIDLTDVVHPDNREMAIRAAKAIGLDVCGVDFITPDITQSYREIGGGICEVNTAPGFRMHVAPTEGKPRDVASPVMDMLFPPGTPSRIPIAALTGTNGKTTTARMLAHIQKMNGFTVGLTTTDGVYIDGERTVVGDMTGPQSAQIVLRDPSVNLAVLETARGGLLRAGMGYRTCDVGAVLNIAENHLGTKGIDTLEQLAEVKRIVVEVARECAVLNADDLHCLRMADHTKAARIAYVTMNPRHELVRKHLRAGGLAAVLEEGINGHMITLYDKGSHLPLLWTHLIPATFEGKALHNVQNAMFAAIMAYAMGVKVENIRQGLRTFDTSYFQVPGRTNVYDELPFKVIVDYGHNAAAVQAMADFTQRLECSGRRVCVLAAPGDRRDEDIRAIARAASKGFDHIIVRRDDDLRGRQPGEVPRMLEAELLAAGFPREKLELIEDEQTANETALKNAKRGDLLLLFADKVSRTWKQVIYFRPAFESGTGSAPPPAPSGAIPPALGSSLSLGEGVLDGAALIQDARGVRLARDNDD